ncbi:accessory Sec system glycosyltransferase GtfB [Ignavigranum ruoffiae]|uniref:UDP-N-acetylglucosamine--peptide N-acetylglucosaminyltransferase stabilizing protein GtfB n=1 Tax=Ignavigranum ruoffiae TaxID=89093 RepID=A0A1H8YUT5_9LACT|nr:accessory Sec system glycosylation chaperone GtfB [Ignavigranum ruoffiae]SEP55843.1 accessory Sec system glycosyltransferase GtfB [Ignavigranum ruoffiae]
MLNIVDQFGTASRIFLTSMWQAGFNHPTLVLEDDGYLPENVFSVYQYFMGEIDQNFNLNQQIRTARPLYFNEVPVPRFWEISADNHSGQIHEGHHLRGKIFYAEPLHLRLVKRVDWYDETGNVRLVDCYNKFGRKFGEMIFDADQKPVHTIYYHLDGFEVIVFNHVTQDVILNYQGQTYKFNDYLALVRFFLDECAINQEEIIFNSLSYCFFVAHTRKQAKRNILFWQEGIGDHLPGNMLTMLASNHYQSDIIIANPVTYQKILSLVDPAYQRNIHLLGYCYPHAIKVKKGQNILIFTNSDQIEQLDKIVHALPQLEFQIGAITEMSSKLMALEQIENVQLHPNLTQDKINELWEHGDIYLDINRGNEILAAVETAYLQNLVIFAFEETMHNGDYIAGQHRFRLDQVDQLIERLDQVSQDDQQAQLARDRQRVHANEISVKEFQTGLKGVLQREEA